MKPHSLLRLWTALCRSPQSPPTHGCNAPPQSRNHAKWFLAAALGAALLLPSATFGQVGNPQPQTTLVSPGSVWEYDYPAQGLDATLDADFDGALDDWKSGMALPGHFLQSGPARLGYGGDGEATTLSSGQGAGNPITAYFRKSFEVPAAVDLSVATSVLLNVTCDDGCVVYINGVECCRYNMPPGRITPDTLAVVDLAGTAEHEPLRVTVPAGLLHEGDNVVACEVHQASATSDDLGFECDLAVTGAPLACPLDGACWQIVASATDPENVPHGQPLALSCIPVNGVAPAGTEYRWKIDGSHCVCPNARTASYVIPECSSLTAGVYECDMIVNGVVFTSPPLRVSCAMPMQCEVTITPAMIRILGTPGDDEVKISQDGSDIVIACAATPTSPAREYRAPQSTTPRALYCDLDGGLDLLECDIAPPSGTGGPGPIAPNCVLIGGGQVGDTLLMTNMGGFPSFQSWLWWWRTPVITLGRVTCGPNHLPIGCAPVKFTASSFPGWSASLMTNASGNFFGVLPTLPPVGGGGVIVATTPLCPGMSWSQPVTFPVTFANFGELWCPTCPPCVCPPSGMSLWLPFDESSGLTSANRINPSFPAVAVGGAPFNQAGYVDRSRAFGNFAKHYEVPHYAGLNPGTGNFSVDCWIRRDSGTNTAEAILDHRAYVQNQLRGWHVALSYGRIILQMANGAKYQNYATTATVPNDGCWHMIAVTVDRAGGPTGIKFYIDGALVNTANPAGITGTLDVNTQLHVGYSNIGGNIPFFGGVDEVEFFNTRVLTPTEIAGIYGAFLSGKCKCESGWRNLALFNTGVNNAGATLPAGNVDPHYTLTTSANPSGPGPAAYVLPPFYFPDTALSKWISDEAAADGNPGDYVYRQTVNLTGSELSTVSISGRWACDNDGTVFINGVAVPGSATVTTTGFYTWKYFNITSGFVPGINTLEFRVHDQGGYTGVRVEMTGRAYYCCPCDRQLANLPLRNTGMDGAGVLLPSGAVDPFYTLSPFGPTTYVVDPAISPWMMNTLQSRWISYNSTSYSTFSNQTYNYKQTFSLAGHQVAGASITGRFAADDSCDIYLNNNFVATNTGGFIAWTPFTINSGFLPGTNTLEFRVNDVGYGLTGMRAEMTGTAYRCLPRTWYYNDWATDIATDATQLASLLVSDGDTDGDGQSNFLEFALGTNPLSSSSTAQPVVDMTTLDGSTYPVLRIKVCRPRDRISLVEGEASSDLVEWVPCDLVSSEAQADGTVQETYQDNSVTAERAVRGPRFIRIKIKD